MADGKQDRQRNQSKPKTGLGLLGGSKKKEPKEKEVLIMQMVEGRHHPDSMKLKKMKQIEDSKGNIDFVDLKAKGGRAGYSVGGKAIKGVSKILLKK